jgi:hypothetical protein
MDRPINYPFKIVTVALVSTALISCTVALGQIDSFIPFSEVPDTIKYTQSISNGHGLTAYYNDSVLVKVQYYLPADNISTLNTFYITDNKLSFALLQASGFRGSRDKYFFQNGKMTKWIDTSGKTIDSNSNQFKDKELEVKSLLDYYLTEIKKK